MRSLAIGRVCQRGGIFQRSWNLGSSLAHSCQLGWLPPAGPGGYKTGAGPAGSHSHSRSPLASLPGHTLPKPSAMASRAPRSLRTDDGDRSRLRAFVLTPVQRYARWPGWYSADTGRMIPMGDLPERRRYVENETVFYNDVNYFNFLRSRRQGYAFVRGQHGSYLAFMRNLGINTRMPWGLARMTIDPETDSDAEEEAAPPAAPAPAPVAPPVLAPTPAVPAPVAPARARSPSPTPTEPVSPRSPPTEPAQAPPPHLGSPIHEIDLTFSPPPPELQPAPAGHRNWMFLDLGGIGLTEMPWKEWQCPLCLKSYPSVFNETAGIAASTGTEQKLAFLRHGTPNWQDRGLPRGCGEFFCKECLHKAMDQQWRCPLRCGRPLDVDHLVMSTVKVTSRASLIRALVRNGVPEFDLGSWPPGTRNRTQP